MKIRSVRSSGNMENGQLSEKKKLEYEARLTRYKRELEGFTHKDQKPYWS